MSRKNRTPEENARRAKIRELLQEANISSMADIQSLFRETIAEFMENGLEAELDEELGYSKYDFRNKETDNSRNGHSSKKLKTSFGDVEISTPRDRKGEFEPQLLKKNQTSISQDIEEKILSMYAKGMTTSDTLFQKHVIINIVFIIQLRGKEAQNNETVHPNTHSSFLTFFQYRC
ncbi:MAG: transposase [Segatella copri]|nr:transposase [Segatella copri]